HSHRTVWLTVAAFAACFGTGLCVVWSLLMLWFRKRIQMAIAITKEAARAVNDMKVLILFPVVQSAALLVFLLPWTTYSLYLASSGERE
ncbi:unnamed protein product, partial [Hapterophycus canaliculatus]